MCTAFADTGIDNTDRIKNSVRKGIGASITYKGDGAISPESAGIGVNAGESVTHAEVLTVTGCSTLVTGSITEW